MDNFKNKTAFVTGAASGIGLAISEALLQAGANVMMTDIDRDGLDAAAGSLSQYSAHILTQMCDVRNISDIETAADAIQSAFGDIDLVFNNAGVALSGQSGSIAIKDWQWSCDINIMGVVNGVETFVPHLIKQGHGGHIVNTASMAGHMTSSFMAPYHASKFAVVGYSEALRQELAPHKIGVSVLCPTWVKSNIFDTGKKAPTYDGGAQFEGNPVYDATRALVENGMSAERLAQLVLRSIKADRMYIFNDAEARAAIDMRRDAILADYDACLKDLEDIS